MPGRNTSKREARKRNSASKRNPVTPAVARKIAALTARNRHTEAVLELAKALGDRRAKGALEAIRTVSEYAGETPYDLMSIRLRIQKDLLLKAHAVAPPSAVDALYRAF